jgi:hypothetical protein
MAKKHTRNRRQKRRIARTRKMVGGAYSQTEIEQLQDAQFSENQIQSLQEIEIPFDEVIFKVNQLTNQVPDEDLAEQVMVEILNEQIFQNPNAEEIDTIPHAPDDIHDMDLSFNDDDSLHISHLNDTQDSMRANTTIADESLGNSHMSDGSMSSLFSEGKSFASKIGGKKRRRKTSKKVKKSRKTRKTRQNVKNRKQRGGMCYGNGVGANSYDPNYSIYNTNLLKLFPYKA